jgi:hypothetical protein
MLSSLSRARVGEHLHCSVAICRAQGVFGRAKWDPLIVKPEDAMPRVLVVDDEPNARELLSEFLTTRG